MAITSAVEEQQFEVPEPSSNVSFDEDSEIPAQGDLVQEDFDALVNEVVAMRERLSGHFTFKEWFAARVDTITELRSRFPERGSHDKVVVHVVGHDPEEVSWEEFVEKYLGITPQYLNRLIHEANKGPSGPTERKPTAKDLLITRLKEEVKNLKSQMAKREEPPTDGEVSAEAKDSPEPRRLEATPAYHAGFRARQEVAFELEEEVEDESEDLITKTEVVEDSDVPAAAQSPQSNLTDAISYFATYTKEVPKFAEELRALVRHFGLARKISVELI
jgi:hypothetical protein